MIGRRRLLAAAVLAAFGPVTTLGMKTLTSCCTAPHDQPHTFECPVALARTCDDCQAEPGHECSYSCSSYWI
ncbi:hypothetical protein [Longispora albida]|uniref:hypothetical protein n=1 Tax=Longispora albida TaxID=203523 RepID=UPI00037CDC1F|nr:hypothetical protein [Longispora albida]